MPFPLGLKPYKQNGIKKIDKEYFPAGITDQEKTSIVKINIGTRIPKTYFISGNELQDKINQYRDIIELSRPIMRSFTTKFNDHMQLNLIDSEGCILYSLYDDHIGAICPGFSFINKNATIKESLLRGDVIDLYSEEANKDLMCMPIVTKDSVVCLTISNMRGKIASQYIETAAYIYNILYIQYKMVSELKKVTDSLLELNHDYTLIIDQNGFIANANRKCLDLFDVTAKELLTGIPVESIIADCPGLFDFTVSSVHSSFKVFAQNEWHPVELVSRNVIEMPGGSRQIALLFRKRINRDNILMFHPKDLIHPSDAFQRITGSHPKIKKNISLARKAAKLPTTVLIEGESGTGKELLAQGIHLASGRKGPFVAINCGGLSRELLQSELFGYAEGAFTGAKRGGRIGKFQQADGGTVFLDEIGEMSEDMQVSLLRFLQDKVIIPLADNTPQKVDVRVIAATNRNLRQQVMSGGFRKDLFYRLNVVNIIMPPLRDRKEDIPLLANHIVNDICREYQITPKTFSPKCLKKLAQHDWPGNVRELHNVIEQALVVSLPDEKMIDNVLIDHLPQEEKLTAMEKTTITDLLNKYNGNITATAKALGIARTTLYRKIKAN